MAGPPIRLSAVLDLVESVSDMIIFPPTDISMWTEICAQIKSEADGMGAGAHMHLESLLIHGTLVSMAKHNPERTWFFLLRLKLML